MGSTGFAGAGDGCKFLNRANVSKVSDVSVVAVVAVVERLLSKLLAD